MLMCAALSLFGCCGGRLCTCGRNDCGQLGDGTTSDRSTPTEITSLGTSVTAVRAGAPMRIYACLPTSIAAALCKIRLHPIPQQHTALKRTARQCSRLDQSDTPRPTTTPALTHLGWTRLGRAAQNSMGRGVARNSGAVPSPALLCSNTLLPTTQVVTQGCTTAGEWG